MKLHIRVAIHLNHPFALLLSRMFLFSLFMVLTILILAGHTYAQQPHSIQLVPFNFQIYQNHLSYQIYQGSRFIGQALTHLPHFIQFVSSSIDVASSVRHNTAVCLVTGNIHIWHGNSHHRATTYDFDYFSQSHLKRLLNLERSSYFHPKFWGGYGIAVSRTILDVKGFPSTTASI